MEFLLCSVDGRGHLRFLDRSPFETDRPIETFTCEIAQHNLLASGSVSVLGSHPGDFFQQLAENADGWNGELRWESLEGELRLAATHDGLGHITITAWLISGHRENDWLVRASVVTETGLIPSLEHRATEFFGAS